MGSGVTQQALWVLLSVPISVKSHLRRVFQAFPEAPDARERATLWPLERMKCGVTLDQQRLARALTRLCTSTIPEAPNALPALVANCRLVLADRVVKQPATPTKIEFACGTPQDRAEAAAEKKMAVCTAMQLPYSEDTRVSAQHTQGRTRDSETIVQLCADTPVVPGLETGVSKQPRDQRPETESPGCDPPRAAERAGRLLPQTKLSACSPPPSSPRSLTFRRVPDAQQVGRRARTAAG